MTDSLVVVGAGSAGAVIASRVSEDSGQHVTLIEAGPDYPAARLHAPPVLPGDAAALPQDLRDGRWNSMRAHDWGYQHLPYQGSELYPLPRGKVTGGSSAVNTCIALRGQPYDYAEWATRAGSQWSFDNCLPAFKRLENDLDFEDEWHGNSGPILIRRDRRDQLVNPQLVFLDACAERGWPSCPDHNNPTTSGAGPHAMNRIEGVRISTALGYLSQARDRDNLQLEARTLVRRVLFRHRRVCGIELERDGEVFQRPATRVVLCAGAIATPGILMRSGIGPRRQLARIAVACICDLPVGQRLLDHLGAVAVMVPQAGFCPPGAPLIQTTMRYTSRLGPGANDMQLQPGSFVDMPGMPLLYTLAVVVGKPRSAGYIEVRSADPHHKPHVYPRLGAHPDDRAMLLEGMLHARDLLAASSMKGLVRVWPNDEQLARSGDGRWILSGAGSGYHPCGSAPMGAADDPQAVVDGFGRVHGVEGLWVADASIMPTIPTSNINLPTIMIGERFGAWFRDGEL